MKIKEKQVEDVFEIFHSQLLEPGLKVSARQHKFKNGRRADLIFQDKNGRKIILEIKRNAITRQDIGQLIEYRGIMDKENPRVVLAAPIIPSVVKTSFEHFGIEYLEYDIEQIRQLYERIDGQKNVKVKVEYDNAMEVVSAPLLNKKLVDGNVAFKVTYVDNNWSGVCSSNIADFNFKNKTWCKYQSDFANNCQSKFFSKPSKLGLKNGFPCHDSIALKELCFYAGHYHSKAKDGEPKRCKNAKIGKVAIFTSLKPGDREVDRLIFAIGEIDQFVDMKGDNGMPYELMKCDRQRSIIFNKYSYPRFWDYYKNANAPERIAWNAGLFRYINDQIVAELLKDIQGKGTLDKKQKAISEYLLDKVEY